MPDNLSKEHRKKTMASIRSVSKLEDKVSKKLWATGMRFRRNVAGLFGKPDFAIQKYKIVIFIDSCFWHACPEHAITPKTNITYWNHKLERNKTRDIKVNEYYRARDWHIIRIWEHDLKRKQFDNTIEKLCSLVNDIRHDQSKNPQLR